MNSRNVSNRVILYMGYADVIYLANVHFRILDPDTGKYKRVLGSINLWININLWMTTQRVNCQVYIHSRKYVDRYFKTKRCVRNREA